jgi:hypothetical protein
MMHRKTAVPRRQCCVGYGNCAGVSEVIGSVLLITVTVAAVAIIAVVLFSQTTPSKIPNVNFMVGTNNGIPPVLYLTHNGGDTLVPGSFSVYVDGVMAPYSVAGGGEWSLGKNLLVPLASGQIPQRIAIVYNQTGTESALIGAVSANVSVPSVNVAPADLFPPASSSGGSPGEGYIFNDAANISNSSYFIEALKQNVSANRINFYKNSLASSGGLKLGSSFTLRVTDTTKTSQIVYTDSSNTYLVQLNNTDVVKIAVQSQTKNFKTFGIAPQIWEFTAQGADLTITRLPPIPSISATKVDITHTWISSYQFVDSTLEIDTSGDSVTALTVNETVYLPPPNSDSQDIIITNAKPLPVGLFLVMVDDSQKTAYLVGTADKICWGTNCGPFGF